MSEEGVREESERRCHKEVSQGNCQREGVRGKVSEERCHKEIVRGELSEENCQRMKEGEMGSRGKSNNPTQTRWGKN